jgi:hypothetical protein
VPVPAAAGAGRADDGERIARGQNDNAVRRLRTARRDLQAALGLLVDNLASAKIRHAADELEQAIADITSAGAG